MRGAVLVPPLSKRKFSMLNFNPAFGYSHKLKTLYKQGKLPSVTHGLYGKKLSIDSVSLEHIVPHSKGGKTVLNNLALADKTANNLRGNEDISKFLKIDMIQNYLKQFENVRLKNFNGNQYIKFLTETFKKLGFKFS